MRKPKNYWTKERCQEESSKFNNNKEFKKKSKTAYHKSSRNGWLVEFTT